MRNRENSWHIEQGQRYNGTVSEDMQEVEESKTVLDGGSQWPPYSMWYSRWPGPLGVGPGGRLGGGGLSHQSF